MIKITAILGNSGKLLSELIVAITTANPRMVFFNAIKPPPIVAEYPSF